MGPGWCLHDTLKISHGYIEWEADSLGVTVSALRHRIGRLKIKAQNANLPGSSDAANASPQSTPSKRKRGRPSKNAKNEEVKTEVKEEENEPVQEEDMDEDIQADGDYPSDC